MAIVGVGKKKKKRVLCGVASGVARLQSMVAVATTGHPLAPPLLPAS